MPLSLPIPRWRALWPEVLLGTKGDIAGAHVSKVIPLPLTHEGKMKWAVAEVALGGG